MQAARAVLAPALAVVLGLAPLAGCGGSAEPGADRPTAVPSPTSSPPGTAAGASAAAAPVVDRSGVPVRSVLAVSVDGLDPAALATLGPEGAPTLHRLLAEGAATLNARTSVESTDTLPNHTGMLTGRAVDRRRGGHGVVANTDLPGTVHDHAGRWVSSVYAVLGRHGSGGALFVSKTKLRVLARSWPGSVDRSLLREDDARLVTAAVEDLRTVRRPFRFVHLAAPDVAGHRHGYLGREYLDALRRTDRQLARLVAAVETTRGLRGTTVLLTADHGGRGRDHSDPARPGNYTVPFIAWGAGVAPGTDLYELNPDDRRDPGTARPGWSGPQPVRNADVANLALDLLGLPPVPGSRADARQDLDLR